MNKKMIIVVGVILAFVVIGLIATSTIHIAYGAIFLLIDLVLVYSFTTQKDRDIPEELHGHFEDAFEETQGQENFLENKTKTCPVCQTENNIHRKYCKKCNTLIQNMTCPVCGTKNPHTAKYCSHCDSILQNKTRS